MKENKPEVTSVEIKDGHLKCRWSCKGIGFGELDIIVNKDKDNILGEIVETEEFLTYTECMGKEFMEEVLNSMVHYLITNSKICE